WRSSRGATPGESEPRRKLAGRRQTRSPSRGWDRTLVRRTRPRRRRKGRRGRSSSQHAWQGPASKARVVHRLAIFPFADPLPDAERTRGGRRVVRLDRVANQTHRAVAEYGVEAAGMGRAELIKAVLSAAVGRGRRDAPADLVAVPAGGVALVVVRLG